MGSSSPPEVREALLAEVTERIRQRVDPAEAPLLIEVARRFWGFVGVEDLSGRDPEDMYAAVLELWARARRRPDGRPVVEVTVPDPGASSWTPHSTVMVIDDARPFTVDSVVMAIEDRGLAIHLHVHPELAVTRDAEGNVTAIGEGDPEVWIHLETDRLADREAAADLRDHLGEVVVDVAAAVADWQAMRTRALELAGALPEVPLPPAGTDAERADATELLQWLADDHFTFLGYREYELFDDARGARIVSVDGTGLGILGHAPASTTPLDSLTPAARDRILAPHLLILTKTNARATVHRPVRMDYIGIVFRHPGTGRMREHRFIGLYTNLVYSDSVTRIPVVSRKVEAVLERTGFPPGSHEANRLMAILEEYPRDELFQISVDDLVDHALTILHLRERRQVRLLVRHDDYGRFVSCLVFVPRERFSTQVRHRIQDLLRDAFGGTQTEFSVQLGSSPLARLHVVIRLGPEGARPVDTDLLSERIARITRAWTDDLRRALVEQLGEARGVTLWDRYQEAFPAGYRAEVPAPAAVADILQVEALGDDDLSVRFHRVPEDPPGVARLTVYRSGSPLALSTILPVLHGLGVTVLSERPWDLTLPHRSAARIYDFSLRLPDGHVELTPEVRERFEEAFLAVWRGDAANDGFGRLVLVAGLSWREVALLRAYRHYMRQIGSSFSQAYFEDTLAGHPGVARMLVQLFAARFDPDTHDPATERQLCEAIDAALEDVSLLDEDRILRGFRTLICATQRTSWYADRPVLAIKLDPRLVPEVPEPRPAHEIFVYSPRTEGVHLRAGKVARGGIRWSDRKEDYRTEILGLVKAQTVKNAVIVPVGAKGGFIVRNLPVDPALRRAEVEACYRLFIGGLLDVTDNLVDGVVVPPERVVRHDEDDPYLVVAADKGTATFSDVANEIACSRGFWLGDAFASGGSTGYDHKALGITARGAWVSARRHFRELGVDLDSEEVTVVGIGDMSGDVFGNGMLLSRHLKLVAAFDHRHVFVDPDPDPEASWIERRRLFELRGSSWDDYDRSVLSPGGFVVPRTAKVVHLTPEARRALGTDATELTPAQLVSTVLRAPVDMLFNGGIGTFVKASTETHAEAADRANDAVRVDATELRCRVVVEGGNLGLTQRARIEAARRGIRINTDAIDNSAGVDCSDHEVNLKILLDRIVAAGDLTVKQRNELLVEMTDEVVDLVLADNYDQTEALSLARMQAAGMVDVHARHLSWLERQGVLRRDLEFLPSNEELAERASRGEGLTQPELAVLLAYTKIQLAEAIEDSGVPEDPAFAEDLHVYFPRLLTDRFGHRVDHHALRRQIIATQVTNQLVNRAGISMTHRLMEETSAPAAEVARAHRAAWLVYDAGRWWSEVRALERTVDAEVVLEMLAEVKKLTERATRWFLRNRPPPLDVGAAVEWFTDGVGEVAAVLGSTVSGSDADAIGQTAARLTEAGVPPGLAEQVALMPLWITALDITEIALRLERPIPQVAATYFLLDDRLGLGWVRDRITALPRDDRWSSLARSALRDDFFRAHARITEAVLAAREDGLSADVLVDKWVAEHGPAVEAFRTMLSEIRGAGTVGLAHVSVALRELRNLLAHAAARPG